MSSFKTPEIQGGNPSMLPAENAPVEYEREKEKVTESVQDKLKELMLQTEAQRGQAA